MFKFDVRDDGRREGGWSDVWESEPLDAEELGIQGEEEEQEGTRSLWEAEMAAIWESEELWRRRGLFDKADDEESTLSFG